MRKKLCFLMAIMLYCTTAMAQVTTSSMSGKVTMKDSGEEVIGATVQVVHEPSGTRYNAVSNMDGRFSIQGMRTGGPYSVTVSYIGFQPKSYKGITLQLGENYDLGIEMSEDANELQEVVVTGTKSKFNAEKTGASTNINNAQIVNLPTVSRSIYDVTRLSPYGGNGMSFAGADGRNSNFTVDGANFNNNFGLSDGLPGGGNPISLDAIEEMQVVVSPFDVRQTNFIGGGVNAITKSGTNTFRGSAFVYHRNENLRGDAINHQTIDGAREKDQSTTYGFTLGGPIIKDKLFFFVNGRSRHLRLSTAGEVHATAILMRRTTSHAPQTMTWMPFPTSCSANTATTPVPTPASQPMRATTKFWHVWTGTSRMHTIWHSATTIPRTNPGVHPTPLQWTEAHDRPMPVCPSIRCHLPTPCTLWITSCTHSHST